MALQARAVLPLFLYGGKCETSSKGAFDRREHEDAAPGAVQEEMVPGQALTGSLTKPQAPLFYQ